jgi:hypothetical protein
MNTNNAIGTPVVVPVSRGGTGNTSVTPNVVVCSGTTSTGTVQDTGVTGKEGYTLTSLGAGTPIWSANPAFVHLQTITLNNSPNATFDNTIITSKYTKYIVLFNNVITGLSGFPNLDVIWSTNNGSSYLTSGYQGIRVWTQNQSSNTFNVLNRTTSVNLSGSASGVSLSGLFFFDIPLNNSLMFLGSYHRYNINESQITYVRGTNTNNQKVDNIRFVMIESGRVMVSGSIDIYGVLD